MFKSIKHYLQVAYAQMRLDSKSNWIYKSYLVPWLLGIPIEMFSGFYVLKAIMDRVGVISGWSFPQVAFLYGISVITHGMEDLLFIQGRNIDRRIIRGEFDRMLLRPVGVFFQFATEVFNWCGFFSIFPGFAILGYACSLLDMAITPLIIIYMVIIIISGTFIRGAILYFIGSIAFWTKKVSSVTSLNLTLKTRTTQFPLTMYPKWFRGLFTFVIPMGFITFYPVSGLMQAPTGMDFPLPLDLIIWPPVVATILFSLARALFNFAIRHKYESSGT